MVDHKEEIMVNMMMKNNESKSVSTEEISNSVMTRINTHLKYFYHKNIIKLYREILRR